MRRVPSGTIRISGPDWAWCPGRSTENWKPRRHLPLSAREPILPITAGGGAFSRTEVQAAGILSRKVTRQQDAQKLGVSRRDAESINVQRETPKGQTEPLLGPFQATKICLYHRNPPYDRSSPPALSPAGLGQAPLPSPSQAPQPAILYPKPWAAGTTSGADTVNFQILI